MEISENYTDKARYDYNLVRRAVDLADQKAYSELLAEYREPIYFMLLKMVNNKDDADDLTIETFGKAFKNLPAFKPDFAFSTWLFRIATNAGIDYLRKKRLRTTSIDSTFTDGDGDEVKIDIKSFDPDPEQEMITRQKATLLREFVEKLKPRYKNLIELRYYEQLSYEEIAEKLELPLGTVKAQLFRARELLYNVMRSSQDKI
jgi:RNA polymerase sigma-70 factor (ECF subfamily)